MATFRLPPCSLSGWLVLYDLTLWWVALEVIMTIHLKGTKEKVQVNQLWIILRVQEIYWKREWEEFKTLNVNSPCNDENTVLNPWWGTENSKCWTEPPLNMIAIILQFANGFSSNYRKEHFKGIVHFKTDHKTDTNTSNTVKEIVKG